eukprot:6217520-Amphidinium_carterae.1
MVENERFSCPACSTEAASESLLTLWAQGPVRMKIEFCHDPASRFKKARTWETLVLPWGFALFRFSLRTCYLQ